MYKIVILILVTSYFSYCFINSSTGDLSISNTKIKLEKAEQKLIALQKERAIIENKLISLRSGKIEHDLLDEIARREMGLAEPEEKVVIIKRLF